MKTRLILIGLAVWMTAGYIAAGFLNADLRGSFPRNYREPAWARSGCAYATGIGLVGGPVALAVSPFMTGFYQHGWTLSCKPVPITVGNGCTCTIKRDGTSYHYNDYCPCQETE